MTYLARLLRITNGAPHAPRPAMSLKNERGAVIIHVAIALVALLLFAGFIVDHGATLVARSQAQNAADAGALAGANSLITDPGNVTLASANAKYFAGVNHVWGEATSATDVYVPPIPTPCPASAGGGNSCIRVDVIRGAMRDSGGTMHGNTMPTFFMPIAGINSQGTRATATAQVAAGNAVNCIKPIVVVDKWIDNTPASATNPAGWDRDDTFTNGVDVYQQPGFSAATDLGLRLMLKGGGNDWSAGWSLKINLELGNGANTFRDEIGHCLDGTPTVGLYAPPTACSGVPDSDPEKGCIHVETGISQGPTVGGVGDLIALDPNASWDNGSNTVVGGCTAAGNCGSINPLGTAISPRIVPLALFNPQAYYDSGCSGSTCVARVVNILGFFIEGMCDNVYAAEGQPTPTWCGTGSDPSKTVVGRLMNYPGQSDGASGPAGPATFLKVTRLVR